VSSNAYFIPITTVNPGFSGILIKELSIETTEKNVNRHLKERRKEGRRIAYTTGRVSERTSSHLMFQCKKP